MSDHSHILEVLGPRRRLVMAALAAYGAVEPGKMAATHLHVLLALFEHRFALSGASFKYDRFDSGLPMAVGLREDLEGLMSLGVALRHRRGRATAYSV